MNPVFKAVGCALAMCFAVAAPAHGGQVERADYTITLPAGATVDPEGEIDRDHMTTVNLPTGATLFVVVLDNKAGAAKAFSTMLEERKTRIGNVVESETSTFADVHPARAAALTGKINGVQGTFEAAR